MKMKNTFYKKMSMHKAHNYEATTRIMLIKKCKEIIIISKITTTGK